MSGSAGPQGQRSGRFLGSLKDALVAASREDTGRQQVQPAQAAAASSDVIARMIRDDFVALRPSATMQEIRQLCPGSTSEVELVEMAFS